MKYEGSCHCGRISYEVEGELQQVMECNCSHCSRKGFLLWFVPRDKLTIKQGEAELATYTFNKHQIKHRFCSVCGCAPFAFGEHPPGEPTAAINVRCLDGIEPSALEVVHVDGRSF